MLMEKMAPRLNTTPEQLERDSLRLFLERKLRTVESEMLSLARRYGVKTVIELDEAVRTGHVHEPEAFEDYFRFDYLESERDTLRELMGEM